MCGKVKFLIMASDDFCHIFYGGPACFHRLTQKKKKKKKKRFEPVFSTVIMVMHSLFNRMLLLIDLIPVHLLHCGQL